jgi:hypothetical protein
MTKANIRFSQFCESAYKMGGVKGFIARDRAEGTHIVPLPNAHHITHKMT